MIGNQNTVAQSVLQVKEEPNLHEHPLSLQTSYKQRCALIDAGLAQNDLDECKRSEYVVENVWNHLQPMM